MPKYRKLHVASIHSLDIADMPNDFHRLMWTWLPLISCAEGRGLDIDAWLQGQIFPLRTDVTGQMCDEAMTWFAEHGMVERYIVNGRHYYQIVNWHKYQGDTSRESDSMWPEPTHEPVKTVSPPHDLLAPDSLTTNSRLSHEPLVTNSRLDAYADACADTEGEGGAVAPAPPPAGDDFPFQPVPPSVTAAKAKRGLSGPQPKLAANAPPALALLHEFTGYWPGTDVAPALVDLLGDAPDRTALARAVELWRLSGFKSNNWQGICDWYAELRRDPNWTPQARFKRKGTAADADTRGTVSKPTTPQPVMW